MKYEAMLKAYKEAKRKKRIPVAVAHHEDEYGDSYTRVYKIHKLVPDYMLVSNVNGRYRRPVPSDAFREVTKIVGLKRSALKKMDYIYESKSPKAYKPHIGIEIELTSKLNEKELAFELVNAGFGNEIEIKDDSSLDGTEAFPECHELCLLTTEKKFASTVKKLCKVLKKHCSVNKSCGLHVHLDMRMRDVETAYANLFEAQGLLYSMVPASRLISGYADYVGYYEPVEANTSDRYVGINKNAYDSHTTLEVRLHSGSVNAEKIINWVSLLLKIVDRKRENSIHDVVNNDDQWNNVVILKDYKQMKKAYKIRGKLEKYVKERMKKFESSRRPDVLKIAA